MSLYVQGHAFAVAQIAVAPICAVALCCMACPCMHTSACAKWPQTPLPHPGQASMQAPAALPWVLAPPRAAVAWIWPHVVWPAARVWHWMAILHFW